MEYTLIANTGIQFLTIPFSIDYGRDNNKLLFYEWFEEEPSCKWNIDLAFWLNPCSKAVLMSDLEECNFINPLTKELKQTPEYIISSGIKSIGEGEVTSCPELFFMSVTDRNNKLDKLLNHWLPFPCYELDIFGQVKLGPYNWCRCKIIPHKKTEDSLSATLLIAFDTHSSYGDPPSFCENPFFESTTEKEKKFQFCQRPRMTLDFCRQKKGWVEKNIMKIVHGVDDFNQIIINEDRKEHHYSFLATYVWLVDFISNHCSLPDIRLIRDQNVDLIPVEMIIDIGNSRTAAILYEGEFAKVQPLSLLNMNTPVDANGKLNRTDESFDMRIAFQNVNFGDNIRGSSQFVWPSLVRLGTEAQELTYKTINLSEGDEFFSTYSSPKRYLWDEKRRKDKEEWRTVPINENSSNDIPIIEGISNFFNDDGSLAEDELGHGCHYSRKTLMTLAFMEILTQTTVQINSHEYRDFRGSRSVGRYLDKIIITCPTGMSKKEQVAMHKCLKDAIYILWKYHTNRDSYDENDLSSNKDKPEMPQIKIIPDDSGKCWMYDEATCSQFVYLYGLLTEKYKGCCKSLFDVYGEYSKDSLIIGSLDIGAGTSDVMICQYDYNSKNPSLLKPNPLFWDSFDTAGDDMLRFLISNVLLQGEDGILEQLLLSKGEDLATIRGKLFAFTGRNQIDHSFRFKNLRRDFNLQVLIPVMYEFLRLLTNEEGSREVSYNDIYTSTAPSTEVCVEFEKMFNMSIKEMRWPYSRKVMAKYVSRSLDTLLMKIASIMNAYHCDIVLLSGRPNSLSPIRQTFLKYAPVPPNRLIILNDYNIGDWFPFIDKKRRRINNSKSIVPIGAMIGYLTSNAGGYNGLSIDMSLLAEKLAPTTDYFIVNDTTVHANSCFITPINNKGSVTVNSFPIYIGCKQFDLALYPVRPFYVLDINRESIIEKIKKKNPNHENLNLLCAEYIDNLTRHTPLTITFQREDYREKRELLLIDEVEASNGDQLSPADFQLSVQSLNDPECYWLDSGIFDINSGLS